MLTVTIALFCTPGDGEAFCRGDRRRFFSTSLSLSGGVRPFALVFLVDFTRTERGRKHHAAEKLYKVRPGLSGHL
jgi:hypothetical protein